MNFEQYRMWYLTNCISEELKTDLCGMYGLDAEIEIEGIIREAYDKHCKLENYYNTGKWNG